MPHDVVSRAQPSTNRQPRYLPRTYSGRRPSTFRRLPSAHAAVLAFLEVGGLDYSFLAFSRYMRLGTNRLGCFPDETTSWRRRRAPCLFTRS